MTSELKDWMNDWMNDVKKGMLVLKIQRALR